MLARRGAEVRPVISVIRGDPARRRAGALLDGIERLAPAQRSGRRRGGARARDRRGRDRGRFRRSRTRRWTGTRCAPPTPRVRRSRRRCRCASSVSCRPDARRSTPVGAGEAIRIMTGAPIPDGADAIVMVERTARDGADGVRIRRGGDARRPRAAGRGRRRPGHGRVRRGHGHPARAPRRAREPRRHGRRRRAARSRRGALDRRRARRARARSRRARSATPTGRCCRALVAEAGAIAVDLGMARDDEAVDHRGGRARRRHLRRARHERCGVGRRLRLREDRDRRPSRATGPAATSSGPRSRSSRPSRSPSGGSGAVPVFGLPGNPVSSHVSFELFARPALRTMMGHGDRAPAPRARTCRARLRPPHRRPPLHRAGRAGRDDDGGFVVSRSGVQASNVLSGMARGQRPRVAARRRRRRRRRRPRRAGARPAVTAVRTDREKRRVRVTSLDQMGESPQAVTA